MAVTPRIFVSATSGDLKTHRAKVAEALGRLETYAEYQDPWPPDYGEVQRVLRRRLKDCDAVVHLVGLRYGGEPHNRPPGVPRRSFTQMEYYWALHLKKPVYVFLLPETFPWDDAALEADDEMRALQARHRDSFTERDQNHRSPSNGAELYEEVLSLQPLVEKLRAALRRQRLAWVAFAVVVLCICGAIAWVVRQQGQAIAELHKPETVEVKYFKEIQHLRNQSPLVATAQAGGDSTTSGLMSYAGALAAVAKNHGLTADILRAQIGTFADKVLADPNAGAYERAIAEFHRRNYAAATTHATTAAKAADKQFNRQRQKVIESWTLVGDSEKEQAHYKEALAAYQKALEAGDEKNNLRQWTDLAMNVAKLHYELADYKAAGLLFEEILAIREKEFGQDAPETAHALNEIAHLFHATNRLVEAEPLMRRALAIDEAVFGRNHPTVALRLNNFAWLLRDTNRLAEAEPLMHRALAISEATLGRDHPDVAICLNNLAQLLQDTGRNAEAEPLMRRTLSIDEASFSENHPNVARDLHNLALLLKATDRLAEAEPLMRRALAIIETFRGKDHPNVAIALRSLASLLKAMHRGAEAEPLLLRALAIAEAALGKDHSLVATILSSLASLYYSTQRLAEAEPLMRRALTAYEATHGDSHPHVAIALNNLARLLQDSDRLSEAEPLMRRMVGIFVGFTVATGHPHPHLETVTGNYRKLLIQMGDTEAQVEEKIGKIMAPLENRKEEGANPKAQ